MKITALEEYGLRCLLQIAKIWGDDISISEIAKKEGLSVQYVSKLTSHLRKAGLIEASRGVQGGYRLKFPPKEITLAQVSKALGNPMFGGEFCTEHTGVERVCVHECNCSVRSVWSTIYDYMSAVMGKITLEQLLQDESKTKKDVVHILLESAKAAAAKQ